MNLNQSVDEPLGLIPSSTWPSIVIRPLDKFSSALYSCLLFFSCFPKRLYVQRYSNSLDSSNVQISVVNFVPFLFLSSTDEHIVTKKKLVSMFEFRKIDGLRVNRRNAQSHKCELSLTFLT